MRKFFRKTGYGLLAAGALAVMGYGGTAHAAAQKAEVLQEAAGASKAEAAEEAAEVSQTDAIEEAALVLKAEGAEEAASTMQTEGAEEAASTMQTEGAAEAASAMQTEAAEEAAVASKAETAKETAGTAETAAALTASGVDAAQEAEGVSQSKALLTSADTDEEDLPSEEGFIIGADGETYYINGDGIVLTDQIITVSDKQYYLTESGALLKSGAVLLDGIIYRANKYGELSVKAGWIEIDSDWYYTKSDGSLRVNQWISGKYFVKEDGKMATDSIISWGEKLYYVNNSGLWVSEIGWVKHQKNWYYVNKDGYLEVDSIIADDKKMYYLDESGKMVTKTIVFVEDEWYYYAGVTGAFRDKEGWIQCDGDWYYLGEDGRVRCNATALDARGNRFYLGDDGKMVKNEIIVLDEVMFWAGKDGAFRAKEGWIQIGEDWYYTEADGSFRRNAFVKTSATKQYFMNDVGKMVVSTIILYDEQLFYLDKNGLVKMNKGWMKLDGRWYYAIGDGKIMRNQVLEYKGKLYFMGDDGHMIENDGVVTMEKGYLADADGVLSPVTGWFKSGGLWYRADKNSNLVKDRFVTTSGKEYYLDLFGVMQDNCFFYYGDDLMYAKKGGEVRRKGGWMDLDGHWFFSNPEGVFYRGVTMKIKGVKYYFNADGSMRETAEYYYSGYIKDTSYIEIDGRRYHVDANGNIDSWFGIDVSGYQDIINWDKVAADGVDFAIIRVGGRFMASGEIYDDSKTWRNLEEATRVGIPVGVYFFSQAVTIEEAIEEADYTLERIKGYDVQLPVVIDTENTNGGRQNYITPQERTDIIKAFCERVAAAGYTPMYYAGMGYCVDGYVLYEQLSEYMHWCAQYWKRNQCDDFGVPYQIWQYTEKGKIDGIYGGVDCNIWYRNY